MGNYIKIQYSKNHTETAKIGTCETNGYFRWQDLYSLFKSGCLQKTEYDDTPENYLFSDSYRYRFPFPWEDLNSDYDSLDPEGYKVDVLPETKLSEYLENKGGAKISIVEQLYADEMLKTVFRTENGDLYRLPNFEAAQIVADEIVKQANGKGKGFQSLGLKMAIRILKGYVKNDDQFTLALQSGMPDPNQK